MIGTQDVNDRMAITNTDVVDGNWHHYLMVADKTTDTIYLYVDGIQQASTQSKRGAWPTVNPNQVAAIGASEYMGAGLYPLSGWVDEVRVYNRALSPNDVMKLYNWAPGPVAYYKLDEGTGTSLVNDSSGNGRTMNMGGAMTQSDWVDGKFGSALDFDGVNDCLSYTMPPITSYPFTLSAWTKTTLNDAPSGDDYSAVFITNSAASNNNYGIGVSTGTGSDKGYIHVRNTTEYNTLGSTHIADQKWHYLTGVFESDTLRKIYVDGVLEATGTDNVTLAGSINNYTIGCRGDSSPSDYHNGPIDEVKIYNYARTPAQIVQDMNAGHPTPGSPVGSALIHYKFDEGYGDTANNHGNYGMLYNSNLAGADTCPGDSNCPTWTNDGKFGKALSFDGNSDYIITSSTVNLSSTNKTTIAFWLNWDSYAIDDDLAVESSADFSSNAGAVIIKPNSSTAGTCSGKVEISWHGTGNRTECFTQPSATNWHHWVVMFDASQSSDGEITVYVDGILQDTAVYSSAGGVSSLGNYSWYFMSRAGTSLYGAGKMDDFRVYTDTLTAEQVKEVYNQGMAMVFGVASTTAGGSAPSSSSSREYCPPADTSGTCSPPIAEWKMDENTGTTLNDSSGNGYTSTTWTGQAHYDSGKFGSGLYFDGTNDVVRIAPAASSPLDMLGATGSLTVSVWFNITSVPNQNLGLVYKRGTNIATFPFTLSMGNSTKSIDFNVSDGTVTCGSTSGAVHNDGTWHLATGVWDDANNTTNVYVDGVMMDRDACSNLNSLANNEDVSIGNGRNSVDGNYLAHDLSGYIDQVRIYDYARTPAQIEWEFDHDKPSLGWWKLDDNVSGNNAVIYDSSIVQKHGTTVNGGNNLDCTITGIRDLACDFDGVNDNILLGEKAVYTKAFLDFRDFSVAGWFNRDTSNTDDTIVGKKPTQAADEGWIVWIDDTTDKLTFVAADGTDTFTVQSASTFTNTGWNHFVLTWDDDNENNIDVYINGVEEVATRTGTLGNIGNFIGSSRNLRIGVEHDGTDNPYDGKLDDIMIFSHALNATEVKNIYNNGTVRFGN